MSVRPALRIALNAAIDGVLAAVAIPLARLIADPKGDWLDPLWLLPVGTGCVLLAGLPFRLPWQYWRFSGMRDLLGVAGTSVLGAALFAATGLLLLEKSWSNPAFPAVHALTLLVLLG